MTHTYKKFTPLFLAGILCASAIPAQSAESWSSFALKGVATWAVCVGIGLGSTIAHEYGHAISAEVLLPGSVNHIIIGNNLHTLSNIQLAHPLLNPLLFFEGFKIGNAIGAFEGRVSYGATGKSWLQSITIAAAGPLVGAAFLLSTLGLIHYFAKRHNKQKLSALNKIVCGFAFGNLVQLIVAPMLGKTDGQEIQENLGISRLLYNAIAIPAVCYAGYKINQWEKKLSNPEELD